MIFWMISEETVEKIRKALELHDDVHALYALDTGLHTTDEIPSDWKD